jgi:hypothetical protein
VPLICIPRIGILASTLRVASLNDLAIIACKPSLSHIGLGARPFAEDSRMWHVNPRFPSTYSPFGSTGKVSSSLGSVSTLRCRLGPIFRRQGEGAGGQTGAILAKMDPNCRLGARSRAHSDHKTWSLVRTFLDSLPSSTPLQTQADPRRHWWAPLFMWKRLRTRPRRALIPPNHRHDAQHSRRVYLR